MPEGAVADAPTTTTTTAPVTTTTTTATPAFAGKYADEQTFRDKGLNEARKSLGLSAYSDKAKLIGADGIFPTQKAAEDQYAEYATLLSNRAKGAPEPRTQTDALPKIGGDPIVDDNADVPTILTKAGLNPTELAKQWTDKGELTDQQYDAIRRARPSLTRADIKFIAQGLHAQEQLRQVALNRVIDQAALEFNGKRDDLDKFLKHTVPTFVDEAQRPAYDKMLSDPQTLVPTIKLLKQMHAESLGAAGTKPIVSGAPGARSGAKITEKQYRELEKRAASGRDPEAMAAVMNITPDDIVG